MKESDIIQIPALQRAGIATTVTRPGAEQISRRIGKIHLRTIQAAKQICFVATVVTDPAPCAQPGQRIFRITHFYVPRKFYFA